MGSAYYNENDPFNVQWLKHLMAAKVIAPGEIDGRDIRDVQPSDLRGFTQCHFFAGIGVWSYALRLAGWADDRPVWTGSCPCPTFSCAGKGDGFDDPRHLWPAWERLIPERGAAAIFGEQSDEAIGFGWLDLVQTDLERKGYAVGKAVFGAAGVGAPHARLRLYFGADAERGTAERWRYDLGSSSSSIKSRTQEWQRIRNDAGASRLADNGSKSNGSGSLARREASKAVGHGSSINSNSGFVLRSQSIGPRLERFSGDVRDWRGPGWLDPHAARSVAQTGATRGFWRDCDWWHGKDEKFRPIGDQLFPLAHGIANRLGKLRGYGNAIVAPQAEAFIRAYMEISATEGLRP